MHVGVDAESMEENLTTQWKRNEKSRVYTVPGSNRMLRHHRIAKRAVFERRRAIGNSRFLMLM